MPLYTSRGRHHGIVATVTYTINSGVAGWVDTDCSADLGLNTRRIWLCHAFTLDGSWQDLGCRPLGASADTRSNYANGTFLCRVGGTGHIEFWRNAVTNAIYRFSGYMD